MLLDACRDGDEQAVRQVLSCSSELLQERLTQVSSGFWQRTALHLAAVHNHPHVVTALLEAGASPVAKDAGGQCTREPSRGLCPDCRPPECHTEVAGPQPQDGQR